MGDLRKKHTDIEDKINLLHEYRVDNTYELSAELEKVDKEIREFEWKRLDLTDAEKDEIIEENFINKENAFYFRAEAASISGDTVGDPLKDTSGPSLNILIKLSSILSVVFSVYFKQDYLIGNPKNNKPATPATPAKTK